MEQGGGGRGAAGGDGGDMNQQPQDRKPKEAQVQAQGQGQGQGQVQTPQLPQQPVQCPRCDSLNTKFCYYNNYSLSQPRYFCKTCRRYWTQGGTLRNVPVGGGCRKGKRARNNSSSSSSVENSSSRSQQPQPPPPPPPPHQEVSVQAQPNITTMVGARDPSPLGVPSVTPFFQGVGVGSGGYLSSLGGIHHSLNPPHPFDQPLNVGSGDVVGVGSNLGVLSGFNVPSLGSQRQIRPSQQFYQMGGAEQGLIIPSTMANSSAASHRDWTHSFINNAAGNNRAPDGSLWSTVSTTSISGNSQRNASSALMPNQWPNVPGFGPPPSSF